MANLGAFLSYTLGGPVLILVTVLVAFCLVLEVRDYGYGVLIRRLRRRRG